MDITMTIRGRIPSKKNCKMAFQVNGRCMIANSTAYTKWQREASKQLIPYFNEYANKIQLPLEHVRITIMIFAPDRRASDLTNKCESIMDLLVTSDFIKDDNWFVVESVEQYFGGVDVNDPRAEVRITPTI